MSPGSRNTANPFLRLYLFRKAFHLIGICPSAATLLSAPQKNIAHDRSTVTIKFPIMDCIRSLCASISPPR